MNLTHFLRVTVPTSGLFGVTNPGNKREALPEGVQEKVTLFCFLDRGLDHRASYEFTVRIEDSNGDAYLVSYPVEGRPIYQLGGTCRGL